MSIEIIEETAKKSSRDFLPPVVFEVRRIGRSVFGMVIAGVFFLTAVVICLKTLAIGLPVLMLGCIMLFADIVGFVRSKRVDGRFALNFRKNCYLFAGIVLLALSVFSRLTDVYGDYIGLFSSVQTTLGDLLPFLNNLTIGVFNEHILLGSVGLGILSFGIVYWSVNHSKHRNYPFSSVALLSFLVNIAVFILLVFGGLSLMNIVPSNPIFNTEITAYFGAGIYFAFGIVALLWAIRSIIIFTRMRKVKNAVFKA